MINPAIFYLFSDDLSTRVVQVFRVNPLDGQILLLTAIIGALCGAVPLIVGAIKGYIGRGLFSLLLCCVSGIVGGLALALVMMGVATWFSTGDEEENQLPSTTPATAVKSDRERIYEEERMRFEAQQELQKKQRVKRQLGFLLFLTLVIGLFTAAYYYQKSQETPEETELTLYNNGYPVMVVADLDAFKEWRIAYGLGSKEGMTALLTAGRVFLVESGRKALYLGDSSLMHRVKILGGKYSGRTGYVEDTYVQFDKVAKPATRR